MDVIIVDRAPQHELVHLDLTGRDVPPDHGVLLTLTDPREILVAARASGVDVDWAVRHAAALPSSERRCAAFVLSVGRAIRGTLYVVLEPGRRRDERIAGHLLRAGARRAAG